MYLMCKLEWHLVTQMVTHCHFTNVTAILMCSPMRVAVLSYPLVISHSSI